MQSIPLKGIVSFEGMSHAGMKKESSSFVGNTAVSYRFTIVPHQK
jgi:hypothetical protein